MKLKTEVEPDPEEKPDWPAGSVFEYDRFGAKILAGSRKDIWVKECIKGEIIRKEFAKVFRMDKENFYYLKKDAIPPGDDFSDNLIPSNWDEEN